MRKTFLSERIQFLILLFVVVFGLIIIGFLVLRTDDSKQVYNSPTINDEDTDLDPSKLNKQLNNDDVVSSSNTNNINENNDQNNDKINNTDLIEKVVNLEPEIKQSPPAEETNDNANSDKPIDPIQDDRKINIDNLF